MKINTKTTIKFNDEERSKLVDAARILDDVFAQDLRSAVQFDVTDINIVDGDDIATMIRTLITLSDAGEELPEFINL